MSPVAGCADDPYRRLRLRGVFLRVELGAGQGDLPAEGPNPGKNINRANLVRPWLFLFPAIFALGLYLAYPVVGSFYRSLFNRAGTEFIGLGNYIDLFNEPGFRTAVFNNFLWLWSCRRPHILRPAGAQLTDRLSWGNIAKSMIFMPMAISFVGASLIWKFVYANNSTSA
jgi:alpha-glucoside transport system permease protein